MVLGIGLERNKVLSALSGKTGRNFSIREKDKIKAVCDG